MIFTTQWDLKREGWEKGDCLDGSEKDCRTHGMDGVGGPRDGAENGIQLRTIVCTVCAGIGGDS